MFNKDIAIKPFIFENEINEIIEEKGNQYAALRKVQWLKEDEQPDPNKGKLELRKWIIDKDGTEKANKGFTFMTPEGPHQLTETLVKNNYGDTKNILDSVSKRDDFADAVNHISNEKEQDGDGEFFDMRNALLSYNEGEDGDD